MFYFKIPTTSKNFVLLFFIEKVCLNQNKILTFNRLDLRVYNISPKFILNPIFPFLFFSLFLKEKFIGLLFVRKTYINRFHKEYKTSGFYLFSSFLDEKIINKSLRNLFQQLK